MKRPASSAAKEKPVAKKAKKEVEAEAAKDDKDSGVPETRDRAKTRKWDMYWNAPANSPTGIEFAETKREVEKEKATFAGTGQHHLESS